MLGLRWDDVDFTASTVTVNRQWKRGERGFVLSPPKTSRGRRTIDVDEVMDRLDAYSVTKTRPERSSRLPTSYRNPWYIRASSAPGVVCCRATSHGSGGGT